MQLLWSALLLCPIRIYDGSVDCLVLLVWEPGLSNIVISGCWVVPFW
jgi:hypothetical protein